MIIQEKTLRSETLRKSKQFFATTVIGGISLGASIAWTSPILPVLEDESSSAPFHISHEEGSWVGASLAIGSLLSAVPAGYLADRFGQKKCTIFFSIPAALFSVIAIVSRDVYTLCLARFLSGISTGASSVIAPMYISEIGDVTLRGTLGTLFETLIYLGVVCTSVMGAYLNYVVLTAIHGLIAVVCGFSFVFLPENPTFLVKNSRIDDAKKALEFYRGVGADVEEELEQIQEQARASSKSDRKLKDLMKSKATIRGLVASVGLTVSQQLSGIDAITFYTVQIFQQTSMELSAYTSAIVVGFVQLLSALLVIMVIEKANRKVFLYVSSLGMLVCLFILGVYFHLQLLQIDFAGMQALPLATMVCYIFFFAAGLGPIPWMINGELFSPDVKGPSNGITIASNWSFLFVVTKTFPVMISEVGPHYTFYMYSFFMGLCAVFTYYCVPETRGKTLQEIQEKLNK